MNLARVGYRANHGLTMNELNSGRMGLNPDPILIINLPDWRNLRVISRSLFLAVVLLALPSIGSIMRGLNDAALYDYIDVDTGETGLQILPLLMRDLTEEGLISNGQKGLILGSGIGDLLADLDVLSDYDIQLAVLSDSQQNCSNFTGMFDFVIAVRFQSVKIVDSIIKPGGIVITQLSDDPSYELPQLTNYRIVYLRRFEHTMVALRRTGFMDGESSSKRKQTLCRFTGEAKKEAMKGLEDVLFEPPRRALVSERLREIKFLPDLLGDTLEGYPRRFFILDDKNGGGKWFHENYPMKNQYFESFNVNTEKSLKESVLTVSDVSDWLRNNVMEEDYVVMKAEAQVVEEMVKKSTICLVDELFLECKNQWEDAEERNDNERAYWHCLSLYGKLIDEGVAVHQWWG